MNQQTESDIRQIYGNSVSPDLFVQVMACFDVILSINSSFYIKPRNDANELMHHYSLFHSERGDRVVLAGAMEMNPNGIVVPAIRVSNENISLGVIPIKFAFPYRKSNESWTNVEIRNETIGNLDLLLASQLQWFSDFYLRKI